MENAQHQTKMTANQIEAELERINIEGGIGDLIQKFDPKDYSSDLKEEVLRQLDEMEEICLQIKKDIQ